MPLTYWARPDQTYCDPGDGRMPFVAKDDYVAEEEAHAGLQARCFDQGSQSVFDCVKELRGVLREVLSRCSMSDVMRTQIREALGSQADGGSEHGS